MRLFFRTTILFRACKTFLTASSSINCFCNIKAATFSFTKRRSTTPKASVMVNFKKWILKKRCYKLVTMANKKGNPGLSTSSVNNGICLTLALLIQVGSVCVSCFPLWHIKMMLLLIKMLNKNTLILNYPCFQYFGHWQREWQLRPTSS